MQSLVSPYERLLCKRPLLPASAFFLLAREARVEPGLARHSDPFALGAIPLLRCSSDAAAGMSQKRDTGQWSILTGTPPRKIKGQAREKPAEQQDEHEANKDDVLENDTHPERIFSQILTAYDEMEQQHILELQQQVATMRTALEAATATHKQLWDEIARLDKALALVENAVRACAAPASS